MRDWEKWLAYNFGDVESLEEDWFQEEKEKYKEALKGTADNIMVHCTTEENMEKILKEGIIARKGVCLDTPEECEVEPDHISLWKSTEHLCESLSGSGFVGSGTSCALVYIKSNNVIRPYSNRKSWEARVTKRIPPDRIIGTFKLSPKSWDFETCLFDLS